MISILILEFFTDTKIFLISIVLSIISLIFGGAFRAIYQYQMDEAKRSAFKPIMALEKLDFMKAIQPFVSPEQHTLARQIAIHKLFTASDYNAIIMATKNRAIQNTDAFIKTSNLY
jgi:hypothetical protein